MYQYDGGGTFRGYLGCIFGGLLIGFLLGFIISLGIGKFADTEYKVDTNKTIYLESMNDNNNVGGSFMLGFGSIDNTMYYTYYRKSGVYYEFGKVDANKSRIKYTTGTPRIEVYYRDITPQSRLVNWGVVSFREKYVIYVPDGSIKTLYEFDLN